MHIDQLETPSAVVDLDHLEANIARLQAYLDQHGIYNRPHIKTHKIPAIAHMQIAAGAVGIACQKLGEAEIMAAAGISDILIPYNIIGEAKLARLIKLAAQVQMSVTADSAFAVAGLSAAARSASIELPVLVEFDSGMGRCGVQSPQEAADLALLIARSPGLRFAGLMTYPTNEHLGTFVWAVRSLITPQGLTIDRVSGGGTKCMSETHMHPEVTEHRAGMYVYGDRNMITSDAMPLDDCAFTVISTVVSRPTPDRAIIDGGSKTFSSDTLGLEGYGMILEYPDAAFYNLSEEHGFLDLSACKRKPEIGERLTVIPNHCCVVSNLFNEVIGVRSGKVEVTWPVAARGALQ
jgi:D-serine deaminase-like pyridoxal phosphate-dependent protein